MSEEMSNSNFTSKNEGKNKLERKETYSSHFHISDVNECTEGFVTCEDGRDCVNTIGGYTCTEPDSIEPERKKSRVKVVVFLGMPYLCLSMLEIKIMSSSLLLLIIYMTMKTNNQKNKKFVLRL